MQRIRTYDSPHEAELAALYLRDQGVAAEVEANALGTMDPLLTLATGGPAVRVPAAQADQARRLLDELARAVPEPDPDDWEEALGESTGDPYRRAPMTWRAREQLDADARRAFTTAIVGMLLCPGALHIYSLASLYRLKGAKLSSTGRRYRAWALVIDLTVLALLALGLAVRLGAWGR